MTPFERFLESDHAVDCANEWWYCLDPAERVDRWAGTADCDAAYERWLEDLVVNCVLARAEADADERRAG